MRRIKIASLLVVVVAVVWIVIALVRRPARSVKLADGTILRIEKVTYGKRGLFTPSGGLFERAKSFLRSHLPQRWARRIPRPPTTGRSNAAMNSNMIVHTNNDALQIWVSRWDPAAGAYDGFPGFVAELVDEHGCVFAATQHGNETDPSLPMRAMGAFGTSTISMSVPTLGWATFEAFPREQKQFRLRIYSVTNGVTEFTVINPMPKRPGVSKAAPELPVVVKDGGVTFTLKSMSYRVSRSDNSFMSVVKSNAAGIVPEFEVTEFGLSSSNWFPVDAELWDGAGNFASRKYAYRESVSNTMFLCTEENTWRYRVQFCGLDSSPAASNTVWKVPGMRVPGSGEFTAGLGATHWIGNVGVKVVALGGIGETTYANGMVNVAAGPAPGVDVEEWFRTRPQPNSAYSVRSRVPYVAVNVGGMTDDQRLSVRVRDDQGREYYARLFTGLSPDTASDIFMRKDVDQFPGFKQFALLKDSKVVDLTFTVHTAKTVEFIFKPPRR